MERMFISMMTMPMLEVMLSMTRILMMRIVMRMAMIEEILMMFDV
jgi:hypothetical protein